jgi:HSP20 family molecular chaperone IbpA
MKLDTFFVEFDNLLNIPAAECNFKLNTDLEMKAAKFHNGMLSISLEYSYNTKPIKIEVQ